MIQSQALALSRQCRLWTVLVLLAVVAFPAGAAAAADQTGDLQVTCWPGHRIYLDGSFAGLTSSDQDGLLLRGVAAGTHKIRIEKLGFQAVELAVEVPADGITELKVPALHPADAAPPAPAAPAPPPVAATPIPTVVATPVPPPTTTAPAAPVVAAVPAATPRRVPEQTAVPKAAPVPEPSPASPQPKPTTVPASPRPAAPAAAASPPGIDDELLRLIRSRAADRDVMFVYRISGRALDGSGSVLINRERGGPRAPVLAFLCSERDRCLGQTSATYPPGSYRYRVTFRTVQGKRAVSFSTDRFLELEAVSGVTYLLDIVFDGADERHCHAELRALSGL